MSIPKIIHYCWFGNKEKPKMVTEYINSWKKLKGYKIIEWNEKNFDINSCEFIRKAYNEKKWAFVSDYVRLRVLKEYGGIYLDCDVEIKKDFESLLNNKMFMGFIYDCSIGTAVIGAEKNHEIINELLNLYENADFIIKDNFIKLEFKGYENNIINNNNDLFTVFLINYDKNFRLNNKVQYLDNITIFPKEYFERKTRNEKIDFSVHHCYGSWYKDNPNYRSKIAIAINCIIGDILYDKLQCYLKLKKLPYYDIYLKHNK